MITNFDLILMKTKDLADKLMSSDENLLSEELYTQYCSSFEQLMQIIDSDQEDVDMDKLASFHITVKELEKAFMEKQENLQNNIGMQRLKVQLNNMYSQASILQPSNYNKKS